MSRTTRRRAVRALAPVAGLLAAGLLVWQGSYAAFNASTNNTLNAWATGTMALTNNGGTAAYAGSTPALFVGATPGQPENNMKPGATGFKCITVESTGSVAGTLKFYVTNLTGTAGLQNQLAFTIDAALLSPVTTNVASNCTNFPGSGTTNLATAVALPALPSTFGAQTGMAISGATTQRVAYRIAWTFNSTGTFVGDNALQGKTAGADLNWEIQ